MKRSSLMLLLATALLATDSPVEAKVVSKDATVSAASIGRKRKGYKPHRGGLFNTGLFRKKNPCGCPNH